MPEYVRKFERSGKRKSTFMSRQPDVLFVLLYRSTLNLPVFVIGINTIEVGRIQTSIQNG